MAGAKTVLKAISQGCYDSGKCCTRGGGKKTGILGGKRYKEKILDIVQDLNAR